MAERPASSSPLPPPLHVWRADQLAPASTEGVRSSGYAALDAELPGGGWPAAGLIELLHPAPGHGELHLLAPLMAAGSAPLLWVSPPWWPYAPALAAWGVAPERLVVATPQCPADSAWTAEQALRCGALSAVLWWQGETPVAATTLRRLHLAAAEGRTPLFALRPLGVRGQSSPAPLRLALALEAPGRLTLDLFKRRGPPRAEPLRLDLAAPARRRSRPRPGASPPGVSHALVRAAPARVAA